MAILPLGVEVLAHGRRQRRRAGSGVESGGGLRHASRSVRVSVGASTGIVYDHTPCSILALDTTTRGGSVAVSRRRRACWRVAAGDASRTHGERLPGEIARALDARRRRRATLDLLAVATGPGAFTGLRIGLAAIQGLAMTLRQAGGRRLGARRAGRRGAAVRRRRGHARRLDGCATRRRVRRRVPEARVNRTAVAAVEPPTAAQSGGTARQRWRSRTRRRRRFIGDGAARDRGVIARWSRGALAGGRRARRRWRRTSRDLGRDPAPGAARPDRRTRSADLRAASRCGDRARAARRAMTRMHRAHSTRAADLDGVLAIEEASFNNPTTREWYESELKRPDVCFILRLRTSEHPVAGVLRVLAGRSIRFTSTTSRSGPSCAVAASAANCWQADHRGGGASRGVRTRRSKCADRTSPARRLYERAGFRWQACGRTITRSRSKMRWS